MKRFNSVMILLACRFKSLPFSPHPKNIHTFAPEISVRACLDHKSKKTRSHLIWYYALIGLVGENSSSPGSFITKRAPQKPPSLMIQKHIRMDGSRAELLMLLWIYGWLFVFEKWVDLGLIGFN